MLTRKLFPVAKCSSRQWGHSAWRHRRLRCRLSRHIQVHGRFLIRVSPLLTKAESPSACPELPGQSRLWQSLLQTPPMAHKCQRLCPLVRNLHARRKRETGAKLLEPDLSPETTECFRNFISL